ncbi:MAG: hypothetical protein ACM3QS_11805 [Bacteroidota bacterium]
MKILRALFVLFVLLSLFAVPAGASPSRVGFIPLLSAVDPAIPVQLQTEDALRPFLPALLEAQARGDILEFEPSLSTGVLKVVFARGVSPSSVLPGRAVYAEMKAAVSRMRLSATAQAHSPGTEATPRFSMKLYDNCFSAVGLAAGARVIGNLFDTTNRLVALYDDHADSSGIISFGCLSWAGAYSNVIPGYRVIFKEYNGSTNALIASFKAVAPGTRFTTIDKAHSIVRGKGPAGKAFYSRWYHRNWNSTNTALNIAKSGVISATGVWAVDFGTVPIRGNDHLNTVVTMSANFDFDRWMDVPHVYCILGGNYCEASGFAFTPAALKVVKGATTYSFSGKFDADGYFRVSILSATGAPVFLSPGNSVSATGVAAFPLPVLTAAVNYSTNVISGKAPANRYFDLWARIAQTGVSYRKYPRTNSAGAYASAFSTLVDLQPTQPFTAQIYFVYLGTGNAIDYYQSFSP